MSITVYSKNNCPQCKMTKRFLSEHGIEFVEHNVNEEPQYINYLKNLGFMATPVVETETTSWTGFDIPKLQKELIKNAN